MIETQMASREALKSVFELCATEGDENDTFWLVASNHGGQVIKGTRNAKLYCWNEEFIIDSELADWCSTLPMSVQVFVFGQCYSGGFIDNLERKDRVVISASRWDQVSYAREGLQHDEFLFNFLSSIKNGAQTLLAAFRYAVENNTRNEEPQMSDLEGIGSRDDLLRK